MSVWENVLQHRDRIVWGPSKNQCHPNSWQLTIKEKENKHFCLPIMEFTISPSLWVLDRAPAPAEDFGSSCPRCLALSLVSQPGRGDTAWHCHLAGHCSCKTFQNPWTAPCSAPGVPARGALPLQGICPLKIAFGVTKNNVREHKNYPPQPVTCEGLVMVCYRNRRHIQGKSAFFSDFPPCRMVKETSTRGPKIMAQKQRSYFALGKCTDMHGWLFQFWHIASVFSFPPCEQMFVCFKFKTGFPRQNPSRWSPG